MIRVCDGGSCGGSYGSYGERGFREDERVGRVQGERRCGSWETGGRGRGCVWRESGRGRGRDGIVS